MIVKLKAQRPLKMWVLAAMISFVSAMSGLASAQTITVVMQSGLRILDPVLSTAYVTRDHGYMIYDTLFGIDSHFKIQPQMVDKWTLSDDKKPIPLSCATALSGMMVRRLRQKTVLHRSNAGFSQIR